jgi:hypothetical protein
MARDFAVERVTRIELAWPAVNGSQKLTRPALPHRGQYSVAVDTSLEGRDHCARGRGTESSACASS